MTEQTDKPAQASPEMVTVDAGTKLLIEWQKSIHHELKAINGKLSWFVLLSLLAIVFSFFSALLR